MLLAEMTGRVNGELRGRIRHVGAAIATSTRQARRLLPGVLRERLLLRVARRLRERLWLRLSPRVVVGLRV